MVGQSHQPSRPQRVQAPPKAAACRQPTRGEKGIVPKRHTALAQDRPQAQLEAEGKLPQKKAATAEDEEEGIDASRYLELRLAAVAAAKAQGQNPYPHKFETTCRVPEYVARYAEQIEPGTVLEEVTVALAGGSLIWGVCECRLLCCWVCCCECRL